MIAPAADTRAYAELRAAAILAARKYRAAHLAMGEPAHLATATALAATLGLSLDPWQQSAIATTEDTLLLVSRQGGKGLVASLLALAELRGHPGSTTVVVGRADRQSKRLLRRIKRLARLLPDAESGDFAPVLDSAYAYELRNGAEVIAIPGSEETVRGIEAVDLLIVDEAALVPDDLFSAVYPMLATTNGRCLAMTTPRGKRGWFHREWADGGDAWHRARVTAPDIPRISPDWLERTRSRLGDWAYRQEFLCEFVDEHTQFFATDLVQSALCDDEPLWLPTLGAPSTASLGWGSVLT